MKSKIIFYILVVTLLSSIGGVGYFAFSSFKQYKEIKNSHIYIDMSQKIHKIIQNINNEKVNSAIYFGTKGQQKSENFTKYQTAVDSTFEDLLRVTKSNSISNSYLSIVQNASKNIIEARSSVDALSGDYDTIFNLVYEKEVSLPLVKIVTNFPNIALKKEIQSYVLLYINTLKNIERIGNEEAFLMYTTLSKHILNDNNIKLLESLLSYDLFPSFSLLSDKKIPKRISFLLHQKRRTIQIDTIRAYILQHSLDGKYSNKSHTIIGKSYALILKQMNKVETILYKKINIKLELYLNKIQKELVQYLLIMFLIFIIFLVLLNMFSASNKEKKTLEILLREMFSQLDTQSQEELNDIIQRGDTIATYRFLIRTTQEAHKSREKALNAEKAKDLFLANMSHEIRTPLNGIVGFTQLLSTTKLDNEQHEFLDIIETSSNNLLTIVNDILDISKIEADKMDIENIPFNPIEILDGAVEAHEIKASDKKITYSTYVDPHLPEIIGDPTKMSQILTNLIGNAMKFTDYQGIVNVNIQKVKENEKDISIRFSIQDNGIGVSEEQKEHIFEAFSQADVSTTREFGGTGLGLTITSKFIELMGGKLEIKSEIKKGSEFYFTLTFEKGKPQEIIKEEFKTLKIGYFKPTEAPHTMVEQNLRRYVEATGASLEEFNSINDNIGQYDAVIADYSLKETRNNITLITNKAKNTILLMYISYSNDAKLLQNTVDSIIYKPLNIIKIARVFNSVLSQDGNERTKEVSIVNYSSHFENAKILLAEDNVINQKLIVKILKKSKMDITIANNGQEAVDLYKKNEYDIILMDIQMPILGGMEATQEIIKWEKETHHKHTPIIALTANALIGDREKYMAIGMDDYLSKPIDLGKLNGMFAKYYTKETPHIETKEVNVQIIDDNKPKETILEEIRPLVLIYSTNPLIYKIHKSSLEKEGYSVGFADTFTLLEEKIENQGYKYICIDSPEITEGFAGVIDVLLELTLTPLIYKNKQNNSSLPQNIQTYGTMDELKEILK